MVLDAVTELSIVALPIYYVSRNTVKLSSKITVGLLFGLRLPCVALMVGLATSYKRLVENAAGGAMMASMMSPTAVWSEVLLGYALSSASFPCIRSFLTAFLAKYRIDASTIGRSYDKGSHGGATQQSARQHNARVTSAITSRPGRYVPGEAASIHSDASQRMMIERSVEIELRVETASETGAKGPAKYEPGADF